MPTRVVIAGGGVAALEAALALRALAEERVEVELLAPEYDFWYRPLAVAEPFGLGKARRFELAELAAAAGATFSPGALAAVDLGKGMAVTSAGGSVPYDVLLIACGALPLPAVAGAITFRGPADVDLIRGLLDEIAAAQVERVAFCVPWGAAWTLPLYELALMTAAYVADRDANVQVSLVTPEEEPLQLFGREGVEAARELLEERAIDFHARSAAVELTDGGLRLVPEGKLAADRAVALPRLRGTRIDGLPQTTDGFIPVDGHSRIEGVSGVYAAGDITTFPIKQGGIAAQQAHAAAQMIAADAGADVTPEPFRPVLRGLLLTGKRPRYLVHDVVAGEHPASAASPEPLWWPPAKIVGRYLAPFLAALTGSDVEHDTSRAPAGSVAIDVDLEESATEALTAVRRPVTSLADEDVPRVEDAMTTDLLVFSPEDTLAEVAEGMRATDAGPALVCDFGSLIGTLSSRNLLDAFARRVHPSEARARAWMTAEPVCVQREMPVLAAVRLMTELGLDYVPVVEDERPVGMLLLREALRHVPRRSGIGLGF